jgi:hypothetical protein
MSTQHTPGPWIGKNKHGKYNPDHTWSADDENKSNSETAAIWAGGKVIALVVHSSNRFTFESDPSIDANASLIAAAPDLLEALQDLFGADMEHVLMGDGKDDQIEAIAKARAAIAKATGAA